MYDLIICAWSWPIRSVLPVSREQKCSGIVTIKAWLKHEFDTTYNGRRQLWFKSLEAIHVQSIFYDRPVTAPADCPQEQPEYWIEPGVHESMQVRHLSTHYRHGLISQSLYSMRKQQKIINGTNSQECFDFPHVLTIALQSSSTIRHVVNVCTFVLTRKQQWWRGNNRGLVKPN